MTKREPYKSVARRGFYVDAQDMIPVIATFDWNGDLCIEQDGKRINIPRRAIGMFQVAVADLKENI